MAYACILISCNCCTGWLFFKWLFGADNHKTSSEVSWSSMEIRQYISKNWSTMKNYLLSTHYFYPSWDKVRKEVCRDWSGYQERAHSPRKRRDRRKLGGYLDSSVSSDKSGGKLHLIRKLALGSCGKMSDRFTKWCSEWRGSEDQKKKKKSSKISSGMPNSCWVRRRAGN